VCRRSFARYSSTFVPVAKGIMQEAAVSPDAGMLGGKALEAFALMGDALGREHFSRDAHEVMAVVACWHQSGHLAPADPHTAYVLTSTAQIAHTLREEFAPYLPVVLPPVLQAADQKLDYRVRAAAGDGEASALDDEGSEVDGEETLAVEMRGAGNFEVKVNTYQMQGKEVACRSLLSYLEELGPELVPFLPQILPVLANLLSYKITASTRILVYMMVPKFMSLLARAAGKEPAAAPWLAQEALDKLLDGLMAVLRRESEMAEEAGEDGLESLSAGAECLSASLKIVKESKGECWQLSVFHQETNSST
jgi:importin-5